MSFVECDPGYAGTSVPGAAGSERPLPELVLCMMTSPLLPSLSARQVVHLKPSGGEQEILVLSPRWLCGDILGHMLSGEFVQKAKATGESAGAGEVRSRAAGGQTMVADRVVWGI